MSKARGAKGKAGSSRRNYSSAGERAGVSRYRPRGWANWLGFVLFGIIFVALAAETVAAILEGRGTDPIAAAVMTVAFGYMVYLFATTRVQEPLG